MKKQVVGFVGSVLSLLLVFVLLHAAINWKEARDRGEESNIIKETAGAAREVVNDLWAGWKGE
jgi:hypothetical protein